MKGGRYEIRDGQRVRVSGTEGVGRKTPNAQPETNSTEVTSHAVQKKDHRRKD